MPSVRPAAPAPEDWHADAACRGEDVEVFFSRDEKDRERALELCAVCDVREQCLTWALEHEQSHGIWGGLRGSDLRSRVRERRRAGREAA